MSGPVTAAPVQDRLEVLRSEACDELALAGAPSTPAPTAGIAREPPGFRGCCGRRSRQAGGVDGFVRATSAGPSTRGAFGRLCGRLDVGVGAGGETLGT